MNCAIAKELSLNSIPWAMRSPLLDKCIIGIGCSLDHVRRRRFFMDADLNLSSIYFCMFRSMVRPLAPSRIASRRAIKASLASIASETNRYHAAGVDSAARRRGHRVETPRVHDADRRRGDGVVAVRARSRNLILISAHEGVERTYLPKTLCFHH